MVQIVFPNPPAAWGLRRLGREPVSDREYQALCASNPDLHIERTAEGGIVVSPPAGGESDYRSSEVIAELKLWARTDGRGRAFGSSVGFLLPDGSTLSPDAAWVSNESLAGLTRQQRKRFLRLAPEFVVEVLSPTDNLKLAQAKMHQWIANGVRLAWLIDGDARTVAVYRPGRPARTRRGIREIAGEGPVQGFALNLVPIWQGL